MTRGSGTGIKQVLSQSEVTDLTGQKSELQAALDDKKEFGKGTAAESIDEGKIRSEIRRIDNALEEGRAPKLAGTAKDKLAKEAEAIEGDLSQGMPSRDEMERPGRHPGAIRKHMQWISRNQSKIERYRDIQRTLNPGAPKSIEEIRREK